MFFLIIQQMSKIKNWIYAFRFRTLFLAVSGVTLGTGMAVKSGTSSLFTFSFAILLAVSIQILSNLANDLGDYQKGTDTTGKRQGPKRAVQSGKISPKEMKIAIMVTSIFVAVVGLFLVIKSTAASSPGGISVLLGIGLISILAALFYTIGRYAYGYIGWGDFFAFLFFGPVAVVGTYFLHTGNITLQSFFPAIGLGFVSTMILNINNMRDIKNDTESGKITVASKLGLSHSKIYHSLLTLGVFIFFISYSLTLRQSNWINYIYVITFVLFIKIIMEIKSKSDSELDPYLKLTSISGFMLAVAFSICINIA